MVGEYRAVPKGFWCELCALWVYIGSKLTRDPRFSWWVPMPTHWIVEVFCYLSWEAFYILRLWWLTQLLRVFQVLPIVTALGKRVLHDSLLFVHLIEATDWSGFRLIKQRRPRCLLTSPVVKMCVRATFSR